MNEQQVALYARVSSEQQAEAKTIESQRTEIRARIAADGFDPSSILEFLDEGYSGSTLVRPALERLRDVAAAGGIDRLYVHCPRPLGQSPEDQFLLQGKAGDCRIRASEIPRTQSTRQATCGESRDA